MRMLGIEVRRDRSAGVGIRKDCYPSRAEIREVRRIVNRVHVRGNGKVKRLERGYMRVGRMAQQIHVAREIGAHLSKGARIVDVGCGTGYLLRCLARTGSYGALHGYEPVEGNLALCRALCPGGRFEVGGALDIDADSEYDCVILAQVLEHVPNYRAFVSALVRMARPGGLVCITVPDGREDQVVAGRYVSDMGIYAGHINFWSPESLKIMLEGCVGDRASGINVRRVPTRNLLAMIKL